MLRNENLGASFVADLPPGCAEGASLRTRADFLGSRRGSFVAIDIKGHQACVTDVADG